MWGFMDVEYGYFGFCEKPRLWMRRGEGREGGIYKSLEIGCGGL
jgi:hypothetical protein